MKHTQKLVLVGYMASYQDLGIQPLFELEGSVRPSMTDHGCRGREGANKCRCDHCYPPYRRSWDWRTAMEEEEPERPGWHHARHQRAKNRVARRYTELKRRYEIARSARLSAEHAVLRTKRDVAYAGDALADVEKRQAATFSLLFTREFYRERVTKAGAAVIVALDARDAAFLAFDAAHEAEVVASLALAAFAKRMPRS